MSASTNIIRQCFHWVTLSATVALLTACGGGGGGGGGGGDNNQPPTAAADSGATSADTNLTFPASSILSNDTDPDGDSLSVSAVGATSAQGATVTLNAGIISYDPTGVTAFTALAAGETPPGPDTFSYTVSDGNGGTDTGTVSVTVTGINDAPTAADDAGVINADVVLAIPASSLLSNDMDPDTGDSLNVTAVDAVSVQGAAVTLNAGVISYDPIGVAAFTALADGEPLLVPDTFSYTVSDGNGGTDTATVSVTVTGVNDAPTATDDAGATTNADTILVIPANSLLLNDTDPDTSDSLSVTAVGTTSAQGAAVTLNAGNISYDPRGVTDFIALAAGQTLPGPDTFSYTVSDGNGGTDTATVSVTVTGVNDAPVALATCSTMRKQTPLHDTLSADDLDTSDLLTYSVETQGSKGTITITNSTTGEYTYTPNNGAWGKDSFTFRVEDLEGAFDIGTETVIIDPRIMPLGDSITRGSFGGGTPADEDKIGYRKPLYDGLVAAGYSFDFVGTVDTDGTNPIYVPFDVGSEGHGGWSAYQIANGNSGDLLAGNITDWLNSTSPDIILLHIGTNGLVPVYDNATDVGTILDRIDTWESNNNHPITVILARIIDQNPINPNVALFNTELDAMVAGRTGDDIIVVDMENVLTPGSADYADTVHPTNAGYAKMAPVWQTALEGISSFEKCP